MEQDQLISQNPDRSDSVASLSSAPLPTEVGKEDDEEHPPIRKVRGLTPPDASASEESSPLSPLQDFEYWDADMEEFLNRPKTKEQLRNELHRVSISERRLSSTTSHLEQHVKVQQVLMARSEHLRNKWGLQCNCFAAFVKVLPEDVKAEALRTSTHSSYLSWSMDEDRRRREELRQFLEGMFNDDESGAEGGSNVVEKAMADEANRTPSPVGERMSSEFY